MYKGASQASQSTLFMELLRVCSSNPSAGGCIIARGVFPGVETVRVSSSISLGQRAVMSSFGPFEAPLTKEHGIMLYIPSARCM
jgi:hypothetical protein